MPRAVYHFERIPVYHRAWLVLFGSIVVVASCSKRQTEHPGVSDKEVAPSPSAMTSVAAADLADWDPVAEFAELESAPVADRGARALEFYRSWGQRDGESAVQHAEVRGAKIASASLREAFGGWLASDPEAASSWVKGLPPGRRLTKLAGALGEALDGPGARAAWAADQNDPTTGQRLLSRALTEWGRSDSAEGAIRWLENNGGLVERAGELGQLVRAWAGNDATSASEALSRLPAGKGRDAAVAALVTAIAPAQAQAARSWAETIGDEQKRTELLALVAKIGGSGGSQTLAP
jgi:hypothetical protein